MKMISVNDRNMFKVDNIFSLNYNNFVTYFVSSKNVTCYNSRRNKLKRSFLNESFNLFHLENFDIKRIEH